ncbi:MAG: DUF2974 domain-containing protein [Treponemataceae bacterium]|nr:DUF2974 domain-containing protein [Treponemataceae bacterium]
MANILDYIAWRGDLPLAASPFNEIDALILCQISYLNFDGLLADRDFSELVTVCDIAERFRNSPDFDVRSDMGALINELTVQLLFDAGASERYGSIPLAGYTSIIDKKKEEQFSALSYLLEDKTVFVAFRGTDDTIVGWKEDFNLAIMEEVPAQADAVQYLEAAAAALRGPLRLGGHSKGGNLAIYAAARASARTKKRILEIFNNDGPGFPDAAIQSQDFYEVIPRIRSFYPQFSIVGMLFNHAGEYCVVESDQHGLMQHDPFSWHLKGISFKILDGFDPASSFFHDTFNSWLNELGVEQREAFIETLFRVIQATDAETNSEIEANILQNSVKIIAAVHRLEPELRGTLYRLVIMLFKIAHKKLPGFKDLLERNDISVGNARRRVRDVTERIRGERRRIAEKIGSAPVKIEPAD